jgi:uncharacterized protein
VSAADLEAPIMFLKVYPPGQSPVRVDASDRLLELQYDDNEAAADKLSLTLDNFDLSLFDDPLWKKGNLVSVSWGYAGQMSDAHECVIQKLSGGVRYKVECLAQSILMNKVVKSRLFEGMKRSDVAKKIAQENGFADTEIDVDDTRVVLPSITQAKMTDAQFLMSMARVEKLQFYVDGRGFHFVQRKMDGAPSFELEYYTDPGRGDVIDFEMENDATSSPGSVTAKGRDPIEKTDIDETANDGNTPRTTVADVVELLDPQTKTFSTENTAASVIGQTTATTAAAAKREAQGAFIAVQQTTVILKVKLRGLPRLQAKTIVLLKGIGKRLSGRYYVRSAKHHVTSDGYTMDAEMRSDGTGSLSGGGAKTQDGKPNVKDPKDPSSLEAVEVVDPETKQTRTEYRTPDGGD